MIVRANNSGRFQSPAQTQLDELRHHTECASVWMTIRRLLLKASVYTTGRARRKALRLASFLKIQLE